MSATLLGFALASTLLIVAPGPDTMLVMRNTMRGGRRAGWVTACGTVRAYLTGVLSNLLNPKIGVFFIAFLPAFIPAGVSTARFSLILGLWFMVETGLWLGVVAWFADRGVRWLRRPAAQRWLGRFTGIVLIGFGIRLVTSSR